MVATLSKNDMINSCPETIPTPVLLSPLSVAQQRQMLESEDDLPSTGNAVRDQWVANLRKKRIAAAAGTGEPIGNGNQLAAQAAANNSNCRSSNSRNGATKKTSRSRSAASRKRGGAQNSAAALEMSLNAHHQFRTVPSSPLIVNSQISTSESEALAFGQSAVFGGLDCFELNSPSFTRLFSDVEFPLDSPLIKKNNTKPKRATKAGSKKRLTRCVALLDADQTRPHTPRRKLNCGSATFDDFDLDYSSSSSAASFSGVGTPSNFRVDPTSTRHFWGQEADFATTGDYADTFLDIPTPRFAAMSLVSGTKKSNMEDKDDIVDQPRMVRTSSVEQEGLSQFLEQTNLDGSHGSRGDELYKLPLKSPFKSPFTDRSFFSSSSDSVIYSRTAAAAAAVDECLGKKATLSWALPSPSPLSRRCMTPRDHKSLAEFETMLDEYKHTDIDHELDSFYLDTMESIGNDMNLLAN